MSQLLVICFLREAPERAIGPDRRAGKWGLAKVLKCAVAELYPAKPGNLDQVLRQARG